MSRFALISFLALAIAACAENPAQPTDGGADTRDLPGGAGGDAELTLLGTTRACCRSEPVTFSTLVEIDPATGATLRTIGPVGYAVNGLDYDATTGKLYGSTSEWDPNHSGLIEIDPNSGAGTPVGVDGWGLTYAYIAVNNVTVNSQGEMFAWWDGPDGLVSIDKTSGVATLVGESGVATFTNGLAFDNADVLYLVNVDGPVYTVDPTTGAATYTGKIGTNAHHGDFDPSSNLYYGISGYPQSEPQALVVADLSTNTVIASFDELDDDIHTVAFYQPAPKAPMTLDVDVDIKPGSCRNPVNVKAKGVLPVAILGGEGFDVTQIDPSTVQLEGMAPLRWSLEDVATPYATIAEDAQACLESGPDSWADLTLKFDNQQIIAALGDVEDGDVLILTLTGNLTGEFGGSAIEGRDAIEILRKGKSR
jgi:hypothetical protein